MKMSVLVCLLLASCCVEITSSSTPSLQSPAADGLSNDEQELINLEKTIKMKKAAEKDRALMDQQDEDKVKKEINELLSIYALDKKEVAKNGKEDEDITLEDAKEIINLVEKEGATETKKENLKRLFKEILLGDNDIPKDALPKKDEKKKDKLSDEAIEELFKIYKDTEKSSQKETNDDESEIIEKLLEKKEKDESCQDVLPSRDCYWFAFNGTCSTHRKEMEKRCKRSCRFCCEDSPEASVCKLIKGLKNPQETCQNQNYHERLRIICPKLCRFCGRAMAEIPCVRSKYGCCWDGSIAKNHVGTANDGCPVCRDYKIDIFCRRMQDDCRQRYTAGDQIRQICPKTCRRCGPHVQCEDHPNMQDTCITMKYQELCETSFNMMKFMCPKTCGICKKSTINCKETQFGCCKDGITISKSFGRKSCPECHDMPGKFDCAFLAKHNACNTHENLMNTFCAGSCEVCKTK